MRNPKNQCLNCGFFNFTLEDGAKNRGCTSPKKLRINQGVCLNWHDRYSMLDKMQFLFKLKKPRRVSIIV